MGPNPADPSDERLLGPKQVSVKRNYVKLALPLIRLIYSFDRIPNGQREESLTTPHKAGSRSFDRPTTSEPKHRTLAMLFNRHPDKKGSLTQLEIYLRLVA